MRSIGVSDPVDWHRVVYGIESFCDHNCIHWLPVHVYANHGEANTPRTTFQKQLPQHCLIVAVQDFNRTTLILLNDINLK